MTNDNLTLDFDVTLTAEVVNDAIHTAKGAVKNSWGGYPEIDWHSWTNYNPNGKTADEKFPPLKLDIGGVEYGIEVVEDGGGMDEGSRAYVILKVGNQLFRKSGYYASHYGYDWDGTFEEVVAQEKTVVHYVAV